MSRPIFWALGVLVTSGVSALVAGDRLSARFGGTGTVGAAVAETGRVVTLSADLRGHYLVHPSVNGRRVRMLVDTGATLVALTFEDARLLGLDPRPHEFKRPVSTANGVVHVANVRLPELVVGDIAVRDVEAVVMPQGRLGTSLLGMSFLRRLPSFEMSGGRLTLRG